MDATLSKTLPRLIAPLNDDFVADVEGMGIYHLDQKRYLVASSQGNNSYGVFALDDRNRYLGSFTIDMNLPANIDGVSETDGLEISSLSFGDAFPNGVMVAQDGRNVMPSLNQNFKLVDATQIAQLIRHWL
ncbi:phytase [Paraglaciecola sp. Hal342]